MSDERLDQLLSLWKARMPSAPTKAEIVRLLEGEYLAYEINLLLWEPEGMEGDEELRFDLIDSLYTITHPAALARLKEECEELSASFEEDEELPIDLELTPEEEQALERILAAGDEDEEDDPPISEEDLDDLMWREAFTSGLEELPHTVMSFQHAKGDRVSVLLEREGDAITGFKVYGAAGCGLTDRLIALIGFAECREQDEPDGPFMVPGDLQDEVFVQYLYAAQRHGILGPTDAP